jgi:hypothetical protein
MVSIDRIVVCRFAMWASCGLMAMTAGIPAAGETLADPVVFQLNKGVFESGSVNETDAGLLLAADSRVRYDLGKAYGLRNGRLTVLFIPPKISSPNMPLLSERPECFCAFKVHIGRLVAELSDRGIRLFLQDNSHSRIDHVYAEKIMNMVPDGTPKSCEIAIEDRIAVIRIDGDTLLQSPVDNYDFSLLHLASFGHPFTVTKLSLQATIKPPIIIDWATRSVLLGGTYYPSRFNKGAGLHHHHLITWQGGKAGMQALFQTAAPDSAVHDALVALGIKPGNNLTLDTWSKRRTAASKEPDKLADGDRLEITILYGGQEFSTQEVLADLKGNAYDFRFAGNRTFIPAWKSGCVVCLQSCPGSKISNRTYSIRDLEKKKVSFKPADALPFKDGDPIAVRIKPVQ